MSSVPATDWSVPLIGGKHQFLLRRLHSLTGVLFGGYVLFHLFINATIAQGGKVYQTQVQGIHNLPFLWVIEWTFIYLPILFHTVYGVWITLTGQPNLYNYPFARNTLYLLQRISAVVLVVFIAFHVLSLKYGWFGARYAFAPDRAMSTVGRHFDASPVVTWVLYPVGVLAACFHLANGLWTAAITWGLTISAAAQRRWGFICAAVFAVALVAGLTALIAAIRLDVSALRAAGQ